MKVGAILCDYDGTLAPVDVPRRESKVPGDLQRILVRLASRTPVGIVTAKDFNFVYPRTRFARAWACVQGLEIRTSKSRTEHLGHLRDLRTALSEAKELALEGAILEKKLGAGNRLLGFSLDWRSGTKPEEASLANFKRYSGKHGFLVDNEEYGFVDVFAQKPDKGRAVRRMKQLLRPAGAVMFIGDTPDDNPAYREVEIPIAVDHGQELSGLEYEVKVDQTKIQFFLSSLVENDMEFTGSLAGAKQKGGRSR